MGQQLAAIVAEANSERRKASAEQRMDDAARAGKKVIDHTADEPEDLMHRTVKKKDEEANGSS